MLRFVVAIAVIVMMITGATAAGSAAGVEWKQAAKPRTLEEQSWASERGQLVELLAQAVESGRMTYEEAREVFLSRFTDDITAPPRPPAVTDPGKWQQ